MNDEGVIEQMEPEEDQRAVVGDSREQTELEEGGRGGWTEGNKQGHFKDKSDKAVEEKVFVVDDNNPDPKYCIQYIGKGSNETCIVLYPESKPNILNKEGWNSDSEIHAGLKRLKGQFAFVGGITDPALNGDMVLLETHEFVQVINCGDHCVCISTVLDVQFCKCVQQWR